MEFLPLSFETNLRFHRRLVRMARISEVLAALEACHHLLDLLRADEVAILLVAVAVMAEVAVALALTVRQGAGVALWVPWVRCVADLPV